MKFKIQEPMNNLIPKNEASKNSPHAADRAFSVLPWAPFDYIIETIKEG